MMGPKTLLATMDQLRVLPLQVFLMMMFPAAVMSMPRSALRQVLDSMRLSVPRTRMPAPSPNFPFRLQLLLEMMQALAASMPLREFSEEMHRSTVLPCSTRMPEELLMVTQSRRTVLVPPRMP